MSAAVVMKRIAEASPRFKARMAGVLFLLLVLTAAFTEFFARGRLRFAADLAAGIIEVSCMISVTLLFYGIFKPVSTRLSLLAAAINFAALTLELLQFLPHGVNIGLGFHGFYLDPDRLPDFQVDLPASNSGPADGDRGFVLARLLVPPLANYLSPSESRLRPPRRSVGNAVAPRDGSECSTMEGPGYRSRGVPVTGNPAIHELARPAQHPLLFWRLGHCTSVFP